MDSLRIAILFSLPSSVALWNVMKKKPMATRPHTTHKGHTEHWVTAVAAYTNTDLVASGN